jgi:hypothetical protein
MMIPMGWIGTKWMKNVETIQIYDYYVLRGNLWIFLGSNGSEKSLGIQSF